MKKIDDEEQKIDRFREILSDMYDVIPLAEQGYYLFVKRGAMGAYVQGFDDFDADANEYKKIPVYDYSGRQIVYNKSGDNKFTKKTGEYLDDIDVGLVKYDNGTVTEIPGVELGKIKIDKKNAKDATVSGASLMTGKTYNIVRNGRTLKAYINEYIPLQGRTMPYFTLTAKIRGKEAKPLGKSIKSALADKKYYFAIRQAMIDITDGTFASYYKKNYVENEGRTISPDAVQKAIEEQIGDHWVEATRRKTLIFGDISFGQIRVLKYDGKKAKIVFLGRVGDRVKGYDPNAQFELKEGKDYMIVLLYIICITFEELIQTQPSYFLK